MSLSEEIRRKLIATFQTEQREHLQTMTQGLLRLEKAPDPSQQQATLDEIFRAAHSMKGSARAVGMTAVESVAHAQEELFMQLRNGRLSPSAELFDLLYQALDALELLLAQVEAGQSAAPAKVLALLSQLEAFSGQSSPGSAVQTLHEAGVPRIASAADSLAEPPPPFLAEQTIRVATSKLDALMSRLSELVAAKIRIEQRLVEAREMGDFAAAWQKEWLDLRSQYHHFLRYGLHAEGGRGEAPAAGELAAIMEFVAYNQEQLRHFVGHANSLYRHFANDRMRLSLAIDALETEVKGVRMLPFATLTTLFQRLVRDLARQQGKQAALVIIGGETELDRRLLEQVKDPLIHLLRNAVDHGIEPTAVRQKAGKPARATITLTVAQQAHNIVVTVADDGAGLDLEALQETAVRNGILGAAEAAAWSKAEIANLVFRSGLSTSPRVTDISGRGVGLDVVRQNVADLSGNLSVTSTSGTGSSFTMILPLTLASSHGLLLTAGGQTFALPLAVVERMVRVKPEEVTAVDGKEAILYDGQPVALAWLADLLELPPAWPPPAEPKQKLVVILGVVEKRLGLIVDSLDGEQEIVIKSLGPQLVKVSGFMGATLLGSGQIVLVLHAADLFKLAARPLSRTAVSVNRNPDPEPGTRNPDHGLRLPKTILVVDDSITTRTLEKNILETQGYRVKLATNGEEALSILTADGRLPDLIITDINMPHLDGFALTQRVKGDDRSKDIPVILVTSLDSAADKARGIEVGADAYIVKSRFDQGNLLQMIEQLTL